MKSPILSITCIHMSGKNYVSPAVAQHLPCPQPPWFGASVWRTHGQNMSYSWSSIHVHMDLCLDFHGMGWPCTIHHVLTPAILMFRLIHQGYRVLTHPCIWTFNMKTHGNASHFESKPKLTIEAKANRHANYKDLTSRCHRNDGFGLV